MPALLTMMCSFGSARVTSCAARITAARSETSSGSAVALTPNALISAQARSSVSASISASTISTPALAKARQMPRPIPFAAPVTTAPLPLRSRMPSLPLASICLAIARRHQWREVVENACEARGNGGFPIEMGEDIEPVLADRAQDQQRDLVGIESGFGCGEKARIARS